MLGKIINTFGTRTLIAVLNLAVAIIISQVLGTEGKGEQGLIVTTIAFILVFANLVGGATLVYLTPRHTFSSLLLPSYLWSVIISILGFFILHLLNLLDREFILHACIIAVLNSFTSVNSSLLIGKEKIATSNLVNLLVPLFTGLFLAIFFFWAGENSIFGYLKALYGAYIIALIVSAIYIYRNFGHLSFKPLKEYGNVLKDLFRFGFLNQVAHITQMLSFRLSYYVLDYYHGESSVGIYSNAIQIAESIWLISKSISLVQYSRISNVRDNEYAVKLTTGLIKGAFIVSIVLIIPFLLFPESLYTFVFGEGFAGIRGVLWLLAPGVATYSISILAGHYYSGLGKYHVNALVSSTGLAVSVVLFYTVIPTMAENGAGLATSISYIFTTVLLMFLFIRDNNVTFRRFLPSKNDYRLIKNEIKRILDK